ncbi:MAG: hypothetical protein RR659_02965 [Bacilli bacterium]
MKNDVNRNIYMYLLFTIGSIVLSFISFYFIYSGIIRKYNYNSHVKAININYQKTIKNKIIWYQPIYIFTANNKVYECNVPYRSGNNVYKQKNNKNVYFDIDNPTNCITDYQASPTTPLIILGVFPFLALIYSIYNLTTIIAKTSK